MGPPLVLGGWGGRAAWGFPPAGNIFFFWPPPMAFLGGPLFLFGWKNWGGFFLLEKGYGGFFKSPFVFLIATPPITFTYIFVPSILLPPLNNQTNKNKITLLGGLRQGPFGFYTNLAPLPLKNLCFSWGGRRKRKKKPPFYYNLSNFVGNLGLIPLSRKFWVGLQTCFF